jgi:hypothetical protein
MEPVEFTLKCTDQCGLVVMTVDPDFGTYAYTSYYRPEFYRSSIFYTMWRRLKSAWFMLCGKDFALYDLILDKQQFEDYKKFINSIPETEDDKP